MPRMQPPNTPAQHQHKSKQRRKMVGQPASAAVTTSIILHLALLATALIASPRLRIPLAPHHITLIAPPRLPIPSAPKHKPQGGTRLHASRDDGPSADGPPSPTLELIRSWLTGRLPSLERDELELYSTCLLNDGYSTVKELDGLNSGASGKVEDLYFMRKGHRQSLMKQIGGTRNGPAKAREGDTGGRNDELPTGISSTEVDGEFALVEEFPAASRDDGPSTDKPPSPTLELIRSWLTGRLPSLGKNELELYSTCLLNDGYSTMNQLDGLNSGASGKVEDLYFMRKGHRRSLMKQIGGTRNGPANVREGGTGGRNNELPTGISSTEVDGEFALVEEYKDTDGPGVNGEGKKAGGEDKTRGIKREAALQRNPEPDATNAATKPLTEDDRYLRAVAPSRPRQALDSREAISDHRSPGDGSSLTKRNGGASRPAAAASLSEDEQCHRPAAPSRRASASGRVVLDHQSSRPRQASGSREVISDHRSPGDGSSLTKRNGGASRLVVAASLSKDERRSRPAASVGSSGYVTVDDRTGDARRLARREKMPADATAREVLSRGNDVAHSTATRSSLEGTSRKKVLSRATESTQRNMNKISSNEPLTAPGGEEMPLLKSLAREEPRFRYSVRYRRKNAASFPLNVTFRPSSLQSLLKDHQFPRSTGDKTRMLKE